jgi:ribonuclease HIII
MADLTWTKTIDRSEAEDLKAKLATAAFEFRDVAYALFAATGEGVNVVAYASGKLVVQGRGVAQFKERYFDEKEIAPPSDPGFTERMIGADESGKGDYFGPLVAAAVALDPKELPAFDDLELRDSKALSDRACAERALLIRSLLPHEVVMIGPARYNQMYEEFGNLNALLAWAHARAIENVMEKAPCKVILLDKFCEESAIRRWLKSKTLTARFRLETRAEANPAVAAASILARDAFVNRLRALSKSVGLELPKGASGIVEATALRIARTHGRARLGDVAKLHFVTTKKVEQKLRNLGGDTE